MALPLINNPFSTTKPLSYPKSSLSKTQALSTMKLVMAKVHPQDPLNLSSSSIVENTNTRRERETFTIWMKSLVYHGYGCTIYNSNGDVAYRVDNYGYKGSNEVHLMDLHGKVLFTMCRKVLQVFGNWYGYKNGARKEMPLFRVRKLWRMFVKRGSSICKVHLGCDKANSSCYRILKQNGKPAFQIVDSDENIVAEVKPKRSSSGVVLGDDVFTLVVEPQMDQTFVMALVTVYGVINHKM